MTVKREHPWVMITVSLETPILYLQHAVTLSRWFAYSLLGAFAAGEGSGYEKLL